MIARVMTGLLSGVLLSRTASGLIAQAAGWRAVYASAAGALAICAVVLGRVLPDEAPRPRARYRELVAGPFAMLARLPELRRRALFGALIFAAISVIWTTLSFHLGAAPFSYSRAQIGLFGLFGVAGVTAANVAGHLADRQRAGVATVVTALALTASFGVLLAGGSLVAIALGLVLMDAGMQGTQVTQPVGRLRPGTRSAARGEQRLHGVLLHRRVHRLVRGGLVYERFRGPVAARSAARIGATLLVLASAGANAPGESRREPASLIGTSTTPVGAAHRRSARSSRSIRARSSVRVITAEKVANMPISSSSVRGQVQSISNASTSAKATARSAPASTA